MSVYVCQNYWIELSALTANKALVWGVQTVDPKREHIPEARPGDSTVCGVIWSVMSSWALLRGLTVLVEVTRVLLLLVLACVLSCVVVVPWLCRILVCVVSLAGGPQFVAEPGCWPAVRSGAWMLARSWWLSLAAGPQLVAEPGCWPAVGSGARLLARSWWQSLAAGPQLVAEPGCWPAAGGGAWLLARTW